MTCSESSRGSHAGSVLAGILVQICTDTQAGATDRPAADINPIKAQVVHSEYLRFSSIINTDISEGGLSCYEITEFRRRK